MVDRSDVESAIMDAEGAAAFLSIIEDQLMVSTEEGWKTLGLEPREGLCVIVPSTTERRVLGNASDSLRRAVEEVSRVFYATFREGTL